ncbi:hypothetical protein [Vibrio sp. Y58_MX_L22]|uniref:hypothetical protein n=1 Tax=Vibrio sp. Y58_MX_L22 TaxID=2957763 RepID=UPI0020A460D9|nr:hypothetical protein [Vibrio sp. Y58_MX_L22]HDU8585318.1 hypothetical protein [Vibrio alginolyticus]
MQWLTYKTPMLKAPQQAPNSNDKHFTFLRWFAEPKYTELQTPNRRAFLGQAVSDN